MSETAGSDEFAAFWNSWLVARVERHRNIMPRGLGAWTITAFNPVSQRP